MAAAAEQFESYAQNFEDIVLWRALSGVERGTYVDVGAFDPIRYSVSWAFYRQGWRGVAIEPVPAHAEAFRNVRPEDVTIAAAAGRRRGEAPLYAAPATGLSTLVRQLGTAAMARGVAVSELTVPVAPLDELLAGAGLDGRAVHFCKIDVEGSEADVIAGFDLERWSPWVLVVEATEPNLAAPSFASWEPAVLEAGYRFCLFDGLNRFYVHPDRAAELAASLSYPACVLDDALARLQAARIEASVPPPPERAQQRDLLELTSRVEELEGAAARLEALEQTLSWRLTRPLRHARSVQRRLTNRMTTRA